MNYDRYHKDKKKKKKQTNCYDPNPFLFQNYTSLCFYGFHHKNANNSSTTKQQHAEYVVLSDIFSKKIVENK